MVNCNENIFLFCIHKYFSVNESNTLFYFLSISICVLFPFPLGQQEDTIEMQFFFHLFQYVLYITTILLNVFFKEAFRSTFLLVPTHIVIWSWIEQDKYCFISVRTCLLNIELTMLAHYNDRSNLLKSCHLQNWLGRMSAVSAQSGNQRWAACSLTH